MQPRNNYFEAADRVKAKQQPKEAKMDSRKTTDVIVTGTVVRVEVKSRAPYDRWANRYCPNTEISEYFAEYAVETETDTVYFSSSCITRRVTSAPYLAIVTFSRDETDFLKKVGDVAVAEPGKPSNVRLESKFKVGDTITVVGRLKASKVSQKGRPYRSLTHCHTKEV